jgi:beta-phosphoglucomutase family hydrolase
MISIPAHIRGLVFDCDGTIADTMPAHYRAWVQALGEHGVEFPEAMFYEMGGIPTPKIVEVLNERHGHTMPVMETALYKESLFEKEIAGVLAIEPVVRVICEYDGKLPMAVATGGFRHVCKKILETVGVADRFPVIVAAEDVKHGKPAPDVFLEAARQIGVDPRLCMAFEDANLGIQSATAAGMTVVDVRHYYKPAAAAVRPK